MADIDPKTLTDRYVAVWNEPDAGLRAATVRELWRADGTHTVRAPEELRAAAEAVGFVVAGLEASGYEALEFRVGRAYAEFVAPGAYRFRSRGDAGVLRDIVKFTWEMVSSEDGTVAAVGLDVLVLDEEGRIAHDYQFVE